jgi:hypothetical protein
MAIRLSDEYTTRAYVDGATNAAVMKSGDTMTGTLITPNSQITNGLAIGDVPVPTGRGAINAGLNTGTMTANSEGAQNVGYNDHGVMTASGYGAKNAGYNYGTMAANGQGAINAGFNEGTMAASGDGAQNYGKLSAGQYATNAGNGSVALLDGSGNMDLTNHAALVLGNGYSMGDRTLVADAVVVRSMGDRPNDATTKSYVDSISNTAAAAYVKKSGDTMTGALIFGANDPLMFIPSGGNNTTNLICGDNEGNEGFGVYQPIGGSHATFVVGEPTESYHAATKGYVDARTNITSGFTGVIAITGGVVSSQIYVTNGLIQSWCQY